MAMGIDDMREWAKLDNLTSGDHLKLKEQRKKVYEKIRVNAPGSEVAKAFIGSIDQAIHDIEYQNGSSQTREALRLTRWAVGISFVTLLITITTLLVMILTIQ